MPVRQVARSVQVAWSVNQLSFLSRLWEAKVSVCVQAIGAINLQHIGVPTSRKDSFFDAHFRICVNSKIEYIHFLAISLTESQTSTAMFQVVRELLLGVLHNNWSKRLFSVVTDRAGNMTGRHREVLTLLEQIVPPRFFRVRYAAH